MSFETDLLDWLKEFEECVRRKDIAAGKRLFDTQVRAFGTVVNSTADLEQLAERQWTPIWNHTYGFAFDEDSVQIFQCDAGDAALVAAEWRSTGVSAGGAHVPRAGRATIMLRRQPGWRAVHTHFSETPAGGDFSPA